ncbi:hypothetical protein TCAL_13868 [Tigriopus californicus]|uniref:CCHC-type domain-containing protein n=1 Tax=Tigriopus californicus TaxID=6832 RepID=A0A553NM65_TIGCA|nr:hypothetical protein TCAL_13868 [Tigriopus californicus]|eukprot:TCALIF_13868-PA protein Name:"Protein of unknown function" AED:0.18 eAED:0.18 QI:0/-1/0/1/-1/1/1/0/251
MSHDADLSGTCRDDQIVTRLMVGISDDKARKDLLKERPFPSLPRAIEICRSHEIANRNQSKLTGNKINKVQTRGQSMSRGRESSNRGSCGSCGGKRYHESEGCPAKDRKCAICQKLGHYAKVCGTKKAERRDGPCKASISTIFVGGVSSPEPICQLKTIEFEFLSPTNGKKITKLRGVPPDSGAAANLIGVNEIGHLAIRQEELISRGDVLYGANGGTMNAIGRVSAIVKLGQRQKLATFIVTNKYRGNHH